MTLPPIITNSPLFKVLDGSSSAKAGGEPRSAAAAQVSAQDEVVLSDAALKKLAELESSGLKSSTGARETASEVRAALEDNTQISLGPDEG